MTTDDTLSENSANELDIEQLSAEQLETVRDKIETELEKRAQDADLTDSRTTDLVNDQWVNWRELSAHPNLKAVKPWILRVTGLHTKYGVDGEWLDKQQIDGDYHMDVSGLENGDVIKVSGASHANRKHRYYRVTAVGNGRLYHEKISESEAIEAVD
ncbi:hypothetical protein SAMN06269185_0326 [Natronoarchaeum philippinense]|uniref:Uncharacterized protein n=1 Tax=Natronoarchaeum philippinense TaxID=558529 RepID=A0A285N2H3_NATPI|nr:hypothetical protein [Natronoarchaeum philippinense]SNZ03630.1 hypothetical protein SAMN06269185_0326 [Natronoarchaeum philippinense]